MRIWARPSKIRITEFIGVAQRGAPDVTADAQMVKMRGLSTEAGFDIAQIFGRRSVARRSS